MTDRYVDELFTVVNEAGGVMFRNRLSRLVIDPERFLDPAQEEMEPRGMGAVYTKTSTGRPLRTITEDERRDLIDRFFTPYASALEQVAAALLARFGSCLILDAHSFPSRPLPYEQDQAADRPEICIGTDEHHTPESLAALAHDTLAEGGLTVERDRPFRGTYVPMKYFGQDARVQSIMIEIRRDLYMDEATGDRGSSFGEVRDVASGLVSSLAEWVRARAP